ncbi:MAG: DUF2612 domain-containing protein [Candidatus Avelusimicrobium sp.]|uniref:DUF2612 domain-containing protein n=1 Tax=Candidatus Avelusimicrobium sp. TaxID=3048833 RepID=UPI003F01A666
MSLDYKKTVLKQYQNSTALNYILSGLAGMIAVNSKEIIDNIANVDLAMGTQLDAIGARIGVSREVTFLIRVNRDFGYDSHNFFGYDSPYGGTYDIKGSTSAIILDDTAYRLYIKVAAYRNISNCSISSLNTMLANIFAGRGNAWVTLADTLKIAFNFTFPLDIFEKNLILNGYFITPAGFSLQINDNLGTGA